MNKIPLIIPKDLNQIEAVRRIKSEKENNPGLLVVDLSNVSFPLSRDLFFVLAKRFHKDDIKLIVRDEQERLLARSFDLYAELK